MRDLSMMSLMDEGVGNSEVPVLDGGPQGSTDATGEDLDVGG